MAEKPQEQRRFFRANVELPATLIFDAGEGSRRSCQIFNISGSGCALRISSFESVDSDGTHVLTFELPNRPGPLEFDCQLVSAAECEDGSGQDLRFKYVNPRAGNQDAIISYVQNRKRFESMGYRVAIPVSMEAQTGLRQFVPYKGETTELGRDFAVCQMANIGLTVGSDVVATFLAPHYRDEIFFQGSISKMDRNARGYVVKLLLDNPGDRLTEFVRHHYADKAKPMKIAEADPSPGQAPPPRPAV